MARIIGIGSEITECLRIARLIERHGEQFIDRVYTAAEVRYCQGRPQSTQHFAARWAAKQAIVKSLGLPSARAAWTEIEIRRDPSGRPSVAVCGAIKDQIEQQGVTEILVTLSHCRMHATAYAIALGKGD